MSQKDTRGGKREGAGRPHGTGKYKAPTKTMRIPIDMQDKIERFLLNNGFEIPFFNEYVQAGYPTIVSDNLDFNPTNLHDLLFENPADSFMLRANGDSMIDIGINQGDILVVDKKVEYKDGSIVIASVNNEFTVKRLKYKSNQPVLMPENKEFKPIPINEGDDVKIFGVVTHSIHPIK